MTGGKVAGPFCIRRREDRQDRDHDGDWRVKACAVDAFGPASEAVNRGGDTADEVRTMPEVSRRQGERIGVADLGQGINRFESGGMETDPADEHVVEQWGLAVVDRGDSVVEGRVRCVQLLS